MGTHRQLGRTLAALAVLLCSQHAPAQTQGGDSPAQPAVPADDTAASAGSGRHDLRFLPGVRLSQSYSSNVLRSRKGQEQDGFITEVSPYLRASVDRPRLQGRMDLSIRNFYRSETREGIDSTDLLRYALGANGHYVLPGGRFGVTGTATIRDVNLSPFGLDADDPSLVPVNRRRFSVFSIAPYAQGQFSTFARYRLEYMLRSSDVSGSSNLVDRTDQRISGMLDSGPRFQRWGWGLNASRQHRDFGTGLTMGRVQAMGVLHYYVNPELRVGASANYSQIDRLHGESGRDSGWGPGLELDWNPSSRTRLHASWADQYYGSTASLNLAHRANRWTFGLQYERSVLTSSDASVLFFNPSGILGGDFGGAYNPIYQALLDQAMLDDGTLSAGLISDAAVFSRRATASIGYLLPRGSILLTAYRSMRERAVENTLADTALGAFTGELEQRGLMLGLRVDLGQRSSVRLLARRGESESTTSDLHSRLETLQASFHARLSSAASAGIGVRRTVQKSRGNAYEYEDNTLFGTLDLRF